MGGEGGKGEKNYIMPHNEKFKPLKSGFEENSNFKNSRDPCLKYPPEVRVQHETYSTVRGTSVQGILDQKKLTRLAGGSGMVKILPRIGLAFGFGAL